MNLFGLLSSDDECNVCEEHGHDYRDGEFVRYSISTIPAGSGEKVYYEPLGAEYLGEVHVQEVYEIVCRDCCTTETITETIEGKVVLLPDNEENTIWLDPQEWEDLTEEYENIMNDKAGLKEWQECKYNYDTQ